MRQFPLADYPFPGLETYVYVAYVESNDQGRRTGSSVMFYIRRDGRDEPIGEFCAWLAESREATAKQLCELVAEKFASWFPGSHAESGVSRLIERTAEWSVWREAVDAAHEISQALEILDS